MLDGASALPLSLYLSPGDGFQAIAMNSHWHSPWLCLNIFWIINSSDLWDSLGNVFPSIATQVQQRTGLSAGWYVHMVWQGCLAWLQWGFCHLRAWHSCKNLWRNTRGQVHNWLCTMPREEFHVSTLKSKDVSDTYMPSLLPGSVLNTLCYFFLL